MRRLKEELTGILFIIVAVYIGISLVSYHKWDPSFFTHSRGPVRNLGGIIGSYISDLFISIFGAISYILPIVLFVYGLKRLLGKEKRRETLVGLIMLILSVPVFLKLLSYTFSIKTGLTLGGFWGTEISGVLVRLFSLPGAYIISIGLLLSALVILSPRSLGDLIQDMFSRRERTHTAPGKGKIRVVEEAAPDMGMEVVAELPEQKKPHPRPPQTRDGEYSLPDINLLSDYHSSSRPDRGELFERAELLEKKLADFNISGKVTQVHPGPVVTMYEFEPSPGIKISKVISLSEDLGRALGGLSVRIATIPGKTPLGIEVPNLKQGVVSLKEIIGSKEFQRSRSKLTLALGKDIYGRPIVADLARMPHLLVAGTTGSGKSVSINSMIMSMIYKARPDEVKMLMIDPKLLELSIYDGIPHLITPVLTNPKDANLALKKMVLEMERRYRLIAETGAKNIDNFNRLVAEGERLPYIVIIIDELADLMFTASKEVEDSIVRLAQMARASGIHLIVATQRPSVDVITGIIKANFPTRIAFQVSSRVDSRTIIDVHGAEQLIGRGDMLLMAPGTRLKRLHGPYVSEEEIRSVTEFIKAQRGPDFTLFEAIEMAAEEDQGSVEATERDELYQKVIEYAETVGEISISAIQRRFKIGYNRAARIMGLLEEDGLVGPPKGAGKPRDFIGRF